MVQKQLTIENAAIGFKNFAGVEGPYNKAGERSFAVFLNDEQASQLMSEGWNVKYPKERDFGPGEEDNRNPHLAVSLTFDNYPAKVILVAGENVTPLAGDSVGMLDWAEITNVDLVIRPYNWTVNGNSGVKAYVKALYVTIETDAFSSKYGV